MRSFNGHLWGESVAAVRTRPRRPSPEGGRLFGAHPDRRPAAPVHATATSEGGAGSADAYAPTTTEKPTPRSRADRFEQLRSNTDSGAAARSSLGRSADPGSTPLVVVEQSVARPRFGAARASLGPPHGGALATPLSFSRASTSPPDPGASRIPASGRHEDPAKQQSPRRRLSVLPRTT